MTYLIQWTSRRPSDLTGLLSGADAVTSSTRVGTDAELIGFMLNLPGDDTFVVRAVTELDS